MAECARCYKSVFVGDGLDFDEGDLCYSCKDARIAELEAQLAALGWRKITEKDLPKVGDEVGGWRDNDPDPANWDIMRAEYAFSDPEMTPETATVEEWCEIEMTHFRAIGPPAPRSKA